MFNPENTRARMLDGNFSGARSTFLNRRSEYPLISGVAGRLIGIWVSCVIVGLDEWAVEVAEWAEIAAQEAAKLDIGEQHPATALFNLWHTRELVAFTRWMRGRADEREAWSATADAQVAEFTRLERKHHVSVWVNYPADRLAFLAHAGRFDEAIDFFESYFSAKSFKLSAVKTLSPLAYAHSRHRGRGEFDAEPLLKAGRRTLAAKLESDWLSHGNYVDAVLWLKLVYGGPGSTLTPPQVIRKAYENMPNTPWPDFLPAE